MTNKLIKYFNYNTVKNESRLVNLNFNLCKLKTPASQPK
jgi:hypothetical protein